jgi:hypothetical protein
MATGFQSAISQIDGVKSCPIHDTPLYSKCLTCGAPTPSYTLNDRKPAPSFSCHRCQTPYGGSTSIDERFGCWEAPNDFGKLAHFDSWLKRIENSGQVKWVNIDSWNRAELIDLTYGESRRLAIFQTMLTFFPDPKIPSPDFPVSIFGPFPTGSTELCMQFGRNSYMLFLPDAASDDETRSYSEQLWHFHGARRGIFSFNASIPLRIHTSLLWETQFEVIKEMAWRWLSFEKQPHCTIPRTHSSFNHFSKTAEGPGVTMSSDLSQGLLGAVLLATNRIASEWHSHLVELRNKHGPFAAISELSSHRQLFDRLGEWSGNFNPVGIIYKQNSDASCAQKQVYFVVA